MSGCFGVINPFDKWKKGELPCNPTVSLSLNQYCEKDGLIIISASLANDAEIDFAIDKLKIDLDSVRKIAKKTLKYQKEKITQSIEG